ncbi:MAG TPA: Gfo/Idh/MocA family oxidoreductase [archaeon]|nr:Gfo/Idh/MocA family oxidoreductase [archaeon]
MNPMDRRKFLRKAGAGAAGLALAGPMIKSGLSKNSPNETINVAVMGIHNRGAQHAESFSKIPNVNVTVLCDIDERLFPKAVADLEKVSGKKARTEVDIRRVVEDKDVDVISIASTNQWHSLATIWACQAGKDVYVEKPVSHNIWEGRKAVEAARKYNRIVQTGSQYRSSTVARQSMDFIHSGKLGEIYMVKLVIFNPRGSFGRGKIVPVPEGVHYDLWLGPAPWHPFIDNRMHYNWHWFWEMGSGETGNNGPHYTDKARWALQKYEHPRRIQSMGGYFGITDCDQETPNTQISVMEYADGKIVQLEVRGLYTNMEAEENMGVLYFGTEGWMKEARGTWSTYYGRKNEPGPSSANAGDLKEYKPHNIRGSDDEGPHFENFINAVRSRKREELTADILEGHLAASMCHLCNIAYRTGRTVVFDSESESFPDDDEAQSFVSREYRYPYIVPKEV